ncbi:MAG: HNH endonuclease [Candidatus Hermodarchaeota archaeon]
MSFSDEIKLKVLYKAHFKCCNCQTFRFIHIHHIIPKKDGGDDTIENAAPLCPTCHDLLGDNPSKREWIRKKRDFWYQYCKKKLYNEDVNQLKTLYDIIVKRDQQFTAYCLNNNIHYQLVICD